MRRSEVGLARFFAVIGMFVFVIGLIYSAKYNRYVQTSATVVKCEKSRSSSDDHNDWTVTVRYSTGDKSYKRSFGSDSEYKEGDTVSVRYDPDNEYKEGATISVRYNPDNPLELAGGKKNGAHTTVFFGLAVTIACLIYSIYMGSKEEDYY